VSHAELALLRHLADKTGLTGGLSRALATPRILVHDRGRVLARPGARANAQLKSWRILRKLRCCPPAPGTGQDHLRSSDPRN